MFPALLAAGVGLQGAGMVGGLAQGVLGQHKETQAKRRALAANYWNMVRNRAELGAWGTQSGLDVKQGVKDSNAAAQSFVRNHGLAGSTITPTLMAANFRRGADQLARIGEQKRVASMGINNAFTQGYTNAIGMPSSAPTGAALSQGLLALGGSITAGAQNAQMNATSNAAQFNPSYNNMYDAYKNTGGYYAPAPVESGGYRPADTSFRY